MILTMSERQPRPLKKEWKIAPIKPGKTRDSAEHEAVRNARIIAKRYIVNLQKPLISPTEPRSSKK